MNAEQTSYQCGPLVVDESKRRLYFKTKNVHIEPRCLPLLRLLCEQAHNVVSNAEFKRRLRHLGDAGTSLRSIKGLLVNAFRKLELPESLLKIETIHGGSYRLVLNSAQITDIEPFSSSPPVSDTTSSSDSFTFFIDGMIVDTVAELLKHHDSMVPIMNRSRITYIRGIEDFTFSIVYASSITCTADIVDRSNDPLRFARREVLSPLGQLWVPHEPDRSIKRGRLLENEGNRELVRKYVEAAARCVMKFDWAFRDWFFGEVSRHLGEDESLFEEGLPPERLQFKNDVLFNYRYPDLQAALGEEATNRAVTLLREAISSSKRRYSTSSLYEFATTSIVGLVTVMRENDISAENKRIWRMPHLLRSLVTQDAIFNTNLQQQLRLKSIITQHALAAALRQVQDIERKSLLTNLLNMRQASPFKEIREILVEYKLLLSEPRKEDEPKAQFVLMEIARLANSKHDLSDRFTLVQRSALRSLDQIRSDQYEAQLYRVFPALRPTIGQRVS